MKKFLRVNLQPCVIMDYTFIVEDINTLRGRT